MSRTFELLQRLEKDQEIAVVPVSDPAGTQAPSPAPQPVPPLAVAPSLTNGNGHKSVRLGEEEVIKLVHRVFRASGPDAPRAVVFSGVEHGDGATWISASAAKALAGQTTASICVVDANVRTPSLHETFGIGNSVGLSDAIAHAGPIKEFAHQIAGGNLWVLTAGSSPSAAALSSENMRARIAELRSAFDYVLIDAPPANLYADAVALGRLSDGIILVLQSNSTRREAAMKAKESFEIANIPLLGAVLNKRTYPIPQNLYNWF